ncbi:hypothetical protein SDC9_131238 [bioreactor metagenome]|uniref:Uncharacterized protein n=1 Tax=bioreactor metagenome TaxID=1076179 RepID=A0A645D4Q0_9ZZZZ
MKPPNELAFSVPIYLFPLTKKEVASNTTALLSAFQAAIGAELIIGGRELSSSASLIPLSFWSTSCGLCTARICTRESVFENDTCRGLAVRCPTYPSPRLLTFSTTELIRKLSPITTTGTSRKSLPSIL